MTKPLGKGLAALLGEDEESGVQVKNLDFQYIFPCKDQPRKSFDEVDLDSLMMSIKEKGVLQPILVCRHSSRANGYEIIAGERRWRACVKLGLAEIPAIIKQVNVQERLELALIENVQRQDLNAIEEAEGYQKLILDHGYTQEKLAKIIGKSRSHIANTLRLNNLSSKVKAYVRDNKISAGHARALLNHPNADRILEEVISNQYNVRETEDLVRRTTTIKELPSIDPVNYDMQIVARQISDLLEMPVIIQASGGRGRMIIQFEKVEQLEALLSRIG
jgi:ParB family chromosome partitioning protein